MASIQLGAALRHIHRLFDSGTLAALPDAQLLGRFLDRRDDDAFAALVDRHGPLVLATCRAVLRDPHDAEDAFQATFLLLARKAGAVRDPATLGGWLHRVARRVAVRANADIDRRRRLERRAGLQSAAHPPAPPTGLAALPHAEIDRLPDRHRLPLVLCHLEEVPQAQAALRHRWSERTLRRRLAEARDRLRLRLERRGVAAPAGLLAAALARESRAAVPGSWARTAVRAATEGGTGGVVSATAAAWAGRARRALLAAGLKGAAAVALGLAALAAVGVLAASGGPDGEKPPTKPAGVGSTPAPARAAAPPAARGASPAGGEPGASVAVRGRVVDPEGRPVGRATVRVYDPLERIAGDPPTAPSGPDGRFDLRVPRAAFDDYSPGVGKVRARAVATAEGFGFAWGEIADGPAEMTLKLVADDVPIAGRLVDLEGRPVAGATVKAESVWVARDGGLTAWLEKVRERGVRSQGPWQGLDSIPMEVAAATGPDGRFTLAGVGRDRIADLMASGPGIATTEIYALTRAGADVRATNDAWPRPQNLVYHAARFEHALAPGRTIGGVVRDKEAGTPIAGVKIEGAVYDEKSLIPQPGVGATTDARGRYRLDGLAPGHDYRVFVEGPGGSAYPNALFRVPADAPALAPLAFDFTLKRGVLVRGRVTDKATGEPVRGWVQTYAFRDNPRLDDFPGYRGSLENSARLDPDGRFAIAAPPGRGLISARSDIAKYLGPRGIDAIKGLNKDLNSFETSPSCHIGNCHTIVEIHPGDRDESLAVDLQVDPGRSVSGTVVDPDGRPIGGTTAAGLQDLFSTYFQPLESAGFEVRGLEPTTTRRLFFIHEGRKLAGSTLVNGTDPGPLMVRLQPWGAVTGRVVDDEGQPRAQAQLFANIPPRQFDPGRGILPRNDPDRTDRDGRFRIEGLVPGLTYRARAIDNRKNLGMAFDGLQVGPGETKDLGDVRPDGSPIE